MTSATYLGRRGQLETYFDHTAVDKWSALTSDEPVSGIRATVRAGRERMMTTLLSWLPDDLAGQRILDAGCGTGTLAVELARRGADVLAVDLSANLINIARQRANQVSLKGSLTLEVGDMISSQSASFDHVVAMDSLIHYNLQDISDVIRRLTQTTERSVLFTFAPRTPVLAIMHAAGRLFPRDNRAPAIEPVAENLLRRNLAADNDLKNWSISATTRVVNGFYTSQAMKLVHS